MGGSFEGPFLSFRGKSALKDGAAVLGRCNPAAGGRDHAHRQFKSTVLHLAGGQSHMHPMVIPH